MAGSPLLWGEIKCYLIPVGKGSFCYFLIVSILFFFWPCRMACGILVPQPGIEPGPLAMRPQSPNHWTAREFPPIVSILM